MKKNSSTGRHARECLFPVGNPGASAPRQRPAIVPFFLPFAGCPHRCLFCAQDKQTGHTRPSDCLPYPQALANLLSELETHHMERTASRPIELAFYGGTFTALPERLQMECLALAMQAKEKGSDKITRPLTKIVLTCKKSSQKIFKNSELFLS